MGTDRIELVGAERTAGTLSEDEVRNLVANALNQAELDGKRVLIIIPDSTRTAPIPLFFRLLHEALWSRVSGLDFMVALGTHQPMSEEALHRLVACFVYVFTVQPALCRQWIADRAKHHLAGDDIAVTRPLHFVQYLAHDDFRFAICVYFGIIKKIHTAVVGCDHTLLGRFDAHLVGKTHP